MPIGVECPIRRLLLVLGWNLRRTDPLPAGRTRPTMEPDSRECARGVVADPIYPPNTIDALVEVIVPANRSGLIRAISLAAVLAVAATACNPPATPTPAPTATTAAQAQPTLPPPAPTLAPEPSVTPIPPTPSAVPSVALPPAPTSTPAVTPTITIAVGTPIGGQPPDRLKPVDTLPTARPQATAGPRETPKPEPTFSNPRATGTATGPQATPKPAGTAGAVRPITKLQVKATPTVSRKGQANAKVDPQKYAAELLADLQLLATAMDELSTLMDDWESGDVSEDEVVAGIQQAAAVMNDVYLREVQRDYPPQLKEVDDYYVETLRAGDRMFQGIVKYIQTADPKLLPEIQKAAKDFQYFGSEFLKRVK